MSVSFVLAVVATVLFGIAFFGIPNESKYNLIAGGLFFGMLSYIITGIH